MGKQHSEEFVRLVDDALTRVDEISAEELYDLLDEGQDVIAVDVRESYEFDESHIPGSKHLSKGVIERDIEEEIPDKDQRLVLYCGGGYRSALAADNLKKMGYKQVKSLAGGMRGWKKAQLPVEK